MGLRRGYDERRQRQGGVARFAEAHVVVLAGVVLEVDVAVLLHADRGFAGRLAAAGAVVVADEHAGVVGQRVEQPPDRPVQQVRAAAGKIAARGAAVGHEQRRSEEHTSELQSLMRISYAVSCLKKKTETTQST